MTFEDFWGNIEFETRTVVSVEYFSGLEIGCSEAGLQVLKECENMETFILENIDMILYDLRMQDALNLLMDAVDNDLYRREECRKV